MTYKGRFIPKNPNKYVGDPNNIIFRSKWEYDILKFIDRSDNIIKYSSEEVKIPYYSPLDKKMHNYYPDLIIETKDNKIFMIEIKPFSQTMPPKKPKRMSKNYAIACETYITNRCKWDAAEKFCLEKNWKFKILTEKEIYKDNKK